MDASREAQPAEFTCELCGLKAPYTYYGKKPPNTGSVVILEESYVMKDPFTPDKDKFLILGSHCSVCRKAVCVGASWALQFPKDAELLERVQRKAMKMMKEVEHFPDEVNEDCSKNLRALRIGRDLERPSSPIPLPQQDHLDRVTPEHFQDCSLFYCRRFCLPCVNKHLQAFPLEIQEDVSKRKPQQKTLPSKKMD